VLQHRHNASNFSAAHFSPSLGSHRCAECIPRQTKETRATVARINKVKVMSSAKAFTTLASVAAAACGLFAFSWVSLALLGF